MKKLLIPALIAAASFKANGQSLSRSDTVTHSKFAPLPYDSLPGVKAVSEFTTDNTVAKGYSAENVKLSVLGSDDDRNGTIAKGEVFDLMAQYTSPATKKTYAYGWRANELTLNGKSVAKNVPQEAFQAQFRDMTQSPEQFEKETAAILQSLKNQ